MKRVILASSSPRRRGLLESACFDVRVLVPNADETWPGGVAADAVVTLARRKLACIGPQDGLVVAADTMVVVDNRPLGKPVDSAAAVVMLTDLSGRSHDVMTGVVVAFGDFIEVVSVCTEVTFRALSAREIERYVQTAEPMDKAGAYGIQGLGGALVHAVQGSYTNVVGLPLTETLAAMERVKAYDHSGKH